MYESLDPSPSGEYFLSVRTVRPYSYLVPDTRFPREVEILDSGGQPLRTLATLPLSWPMWKPSTVVIRRATCPTATA